jgi:hypothetical protein
MDSAEPGGGATAIRTRTLEPLRIDSANVVASSGAQGRAPELVDITERQWDRLSDQRDVLIRAMTRIFTLLNGGIFLFIIVAWIAGLFDPTYRIVDSKTVMTLIGATVVQSGIAFIAITRFLFPSSSGVTDR